jgi:serine phosphatase RsbU (regulator of sigma subunit)
LFYENSTDSAYATLFFAEYDDRMRRLRYANCGHLCGLLLRQNGGLERLDSSCTVLGIFPEWECVTRERPLCPGDTLALYTDGLTESFNEDGQEFGEERLAESLRVHCGKPPSVMVASIVEDVKTFSPEEQYDDITLIVAKCR